MSIQAILSILLILIFIAIIAILIFKRKTVKEEKKIVKTQAQNHKLNDFDALLNDLKVQKKVHEQKAEEINEHKHEHENLIHTEVEKEEEKSKKFKFDIKSTIIQNTILERKKFNK